MTGALRPEPLWFALFCVAAALPGLLLARRLVKAPGRLEPHARMFLALLFSLGLTSAWALGTALSGSFSLRAAALLNVVAAAVCALWPCRRDAAEAGAAASPAARGRWWGAAALAAAGGAAVLYLLPHEHLFGGWDPGVYLSTGASIARTGAITIHDRTLAAMPPAEQEPFYHLEHGLQGKYPGFIVRDAAAGTVQPYFFYLFPVWAAILDAGFGGRGGLYASGLFALLSLAAFFLLCEVLLSRRAAALALLLLAYSIPMVWQARFPTAETVALFFLLGGWVALAYHARERDGMFALVAALSFGCALLAKITSALPVGLTLAGSLVWTQASPERRGRLFTAALAAALAVAAVYYLVPCRESTRVVAGFVSRARGGAPGAIAAAAVLGLFGLWALHAGGRLLGRAEAGVRQGAALLFSLLAGYGYFLRPRWDHSTDAANLWQLGMFVTPLALLLALAGITWLLLRPPAGPAAAVRSLFVAVSAATAVALLHRKQIAPFYLWALRRYVPEVLPALMFFAAAALDALWGRSGRGRVRPALALLLGAAVLAGGLARGRHLLAHRDYAGAYNAVEGIAAAIPPGALTLCVDGWLATPLQYLFARETLQVSAPSPERRARVEETAARWVGEGRDVHLLMQEKGLFSRRFSFEPVLRAPLHLPVLERTASSYPTRFRDFDPVVTLYRIRPYRAGAGWRPETIDIAAAVFGLGEGFYAPERLDAGGGSARACWTAAAASLDLPAPARPDRALELRLRLGGGRPAPLPPPRVEVLLDGRPVGELTPGRSIGDHVVRVPAGFLAADTDLVGLTLRTDTFNPARLGLSGDRRDLGVIWESASLVPGEGG